MSGIAWPDAVTVTAAASLRAVMPARVPLLLRAARANTVSLHHALVSRPVVVTAHRLEAPVLAWTVNDGADVGRLVRAGVDAIISDDPAMVFAALATLKST